MSYPDSEFRNIAIIDDDDSVRIAVGSLLRSCGYVTDAYDSAYALLAAGALGEYHCIVSDFQMPGMSGLALLALLRKQSNPIPMILMTAFPEALLRDRARQGGVTAFLSKPFAANDLIHCLQQARGGHLSSSQE